MNEKIYMHAQHMVSKQSGKLFHLFKEKENKNCSLQGRQHRGFGGSMLSPLFLDSKKKKKEREERVSKQKLLKNCHQGQNVTILVILECLEFKKFCCRLTMVADNSFLFPWPLHFEIHFVGPAQSI